MGLDSYSLIRGRNAAKLDSTLPSWSSFDWVQAAFHSKPVNKVFKKLNNWKLNDSLVPIEKEVYGREEHGIALPPKYLPFDINYQGFKAGFRRKLVSFTFTDVFLIQEGGGFVIFDDNGLSQYSNCLPNFNQNDIESIVYVEDGFFAGDRFSPQNICHFLFDNVGRALLARSKLNYENTQIFFPYFNTEYNKFCRNIILPFSNVMELKTCYHFKKLTMFRESCFGGIQHPAQHCHPIVFERFRLNFRQAAGDKLGFPKKIYVSRRAVKRAPFDNERDIENYLKKIGYYVFVPEEHSAERQLQFFANAEKIIACHGAALTSLVAANKNCSVLELFNPVVKNFVYFQVCESLGIKHQAIFSDTQFTDFEKFERFDKGLEVEP